jgi:hypothetical protein
MTELGPFDGILGFSQGANVAAVVAAHAITAHNAQVAHTLTEVHDTHARVCLHSHPNMINPTEVSHVTAQDTHVMSQTALENKLPVRSCLRSDNQQNVVEAIIPLQPRSLSAPEIPLLHGRELMHTHLHSVRSSGLHIEQNGAEMHTMPRQHYYQQVHNSDLHSSSHCHTRHVLKFGIFMGGSHSGWAAQDICQSAFLQPVNLHSMHLIGLQDPYREYSEHLTSLFHQPLVKHHSGDHRPLPKEKHEAIALAIEVLEFMRLACDAPHCSAPIHVLTH